MDKTLPLRIKVIVKGENITVDYSELAPQTPGPMNAGPSAGVSAAKVAIKSALMPSLAPNDGTFRPISVILPPGTIMRSTGPQARNGGTLAGGFRWCVACS